MSRISPLRKKVEKLKKDTYALYLAYRDPKVPWYAKVFIIGIVGYVISPFDLIPEFIPVVGYLDDIIILSAGIYLSIKMIPQEVWEECKRKATLEEIDGKFKWIGTFIVILVWIFIIFIFVKSISKISILKTGR
ncbi:DUF1232 domain-containing protein [bacterium]|nr:DUF1232 domain-containing protein [bacterium]